MPEKPQSLPVVPTLLIVVGYFTLIYARGAGWIPQSWSLLPVVETAWLSFLVVIVAMIWMRTQKIPPSHIGLGTLRPYRKLLLWVAGALVVDTLVVGMARPILDTVFETPPPVARFDELPGNLPLLLMLLPLVWIFAAFGEEFFYRGFLLTAVAEMLGGSRYAWIIAVAVQAIAFGLMHTYQGPAQAIAIGIGGAIYGAVYLLAGRNLWPLVFAHGILDTLGFVLLYAGVIQR